MKTKLLIIISLLFSASVFAFLQPVDLKQLQPQYINVKHGKIEYYRFGEGSPIVLISGYASNIAGWNKEFVEELANEHEVILFDNRNVGGSLSQSKDYSTKALAEDTHELVDQLNLHNPTILGISMGGMIAQQYALSYPHDIGHLILINTVIAGTHSVPPSTFAEDAILHTPQGVVKRYVTGIQLLAPPKWWAHMTYSLARDHFPGDKLSFAIPESILNEQRHLILDWCKNNLAASEISKIQTPTLVLNGGADSLIPPVNSEILARTIPHSTLLRWQEGGHAMIYQYPNQIALAINNFLI